MQLSGFKSLGDAGWVGFFSNIFPDRDVREDAPEGERFTLDAHKEYAEWANSDSDNLPELQFWHLPNVVMGKATSVQVVGPFVVAVGEWGSDDIGQKAKAFFSSTEDEWSMSHGYKYWPGDRVDGEYRRYRTHEVTVLSPEWAANPVTMFMEAGNMGLKEDLQKALAGVFGTDEKSAAEIAAQGLGQNKALADAAKAVGSATGQKEGEAAAAPAPDAVISDDVLALSLAEALLALQERDAVIEDQGKQMKSLSDKVGALETGFEQRMKALEEADTARKALLPRAIQQALTQRASEKGSVVAAATVQADADKQATALEADKAVDSTQDPLGWMAQMAGVSLGGAPKQ